VSGVSTLFSSEFYDTIKRYLAPGGVLAQWIHLYELDDDLVLSVVAALDAAFASYRAYQIGDNDIVVLASADGPLPAPDWSVMAWPGAREMLVDVPPVRGWQMDALLLFDETTLRPLLSGGVRANSDFRPILEAGAERARFEDRFAEGFYSLGSNRVDLRRTLAGERAAPPDSVAVPPARGLRPSVQRSLSAWLHHALVEGGAIAPEHFPDWQVSLVDLRDFLDDMGTGQAPSGWLAWAQRFERVERDLHWGTAGWVDTTFYDAVYRYLDRTDPPPEARAAVDLMHGLGVGDLGRAAAAADVLVPAWREGQFWVDATVLLDVAVLSYARTGRNADARAAYRELAPDVGRTAGNLRDRLLLALIGPERPPGETSGEVPR
jgi:hypothetical protein